MQDNSDYYGISGFLTVDEIAGILGISRSTALTIIREGEIPSIRVRSQIRVPEIGFVGYLQNAGLDVKQIYLGRPSPTTARAAQATGPETADDYRQAPGVQVR